MNRIDKILNLLSNDDYITANEIAERLQVSSRTIRNDIALLNADLVNNGAEVITKSRYGILLQVYDNEKYSKYIENRMVLSLTNSDDKENRIHQLLEYLITVNCSVKIDDVCDIFYVSRSTLKNDLKEVKHILKKYDIEIDYRANQGLKIIGEEKKIRQCLARVKSGVVKYTDSYFNGYYDRVKKIIKHELNKNKFQISEIYLNNLILHVTITIERIMSKKTIEFKYDLLNEMKQDGDFEITMKIVKQLEQSLDITFTDGEIYYIFLHLRAKKIIDTNSDDNTVVKDDIYKMVTLMLEEVYKAFKIDLRYDLELITLLSLHLVPFKVRIINELNAFNPLLDEIKNRYILAYNMAVLACEKLHEKYKNKISEDEIAYVALHFNVALERKRKKKRENVIIVCGSGRGSAELLAYQVKDRLGSYLNVVDTISAFHLERIDFNNVDYILTTVSIEERVPVPIIEITSFLESNEV